MMPVSFAGRAAIVLALASVGCTHGAPAIDAPARSPAPIAATAPTVDVPIAAPPAPPAGPSPSASPSATPAAPPAPGTSRPEDAVAAVTAAVGVKDAPGLAPFLPTTGTVKLTYVDSLSSGPPKVKSLHARELVAYLRKLGEAPPGRERGWNGMDGMKCDATCCQANRSGILHNNVYLERVCIARDAHGAAVVRSIELLDGD